MKRRQLLKSTATGAAVACAPALARVAAALPPASEDEKLARLFDQLMDEMLDRSPETTTTFGLDKGARAGAKARLDDRSLAAWQADGARSRRNLADLMAIDRAKLTGLGPTTLDTMRFSVGVQNDLNAQPSYGNPYVLSQLTGAYQQIPDFLAQQHTIADAADAEAYLSRLAGFATALDQETEALHHDVALGIVPPDFILARTLDAMNTLHAQPPASAGLVQSLVARARDKQLAGDWEGRATATYTQAVQPALKRQIDAVAALVPRARHDAGVGHLPHGDALYALGLKYYTTSPMPPTEIHQTGLDLVAKQSAEIDAILKAQGMSKGSVGERLRALYADPAQIYPNTDAGKEQLIADLNTLVAAAEAKLPAWFGALPKARLVIRRIPKETEASQPGGYYQQGALDGSRPGAYYINLRDTAEQPRWLLPTLSHHEGIPGHHLQLSLAQEAALPTICKVQFFSGFGEGWALYAEQLAVEMGLYEGNPLGHVGQLHDAMFRSVRLVVDSGMHHMGWSRDQAVKYYCEALGNPESAAITEIERYVVWPGQACSYMLGKLEWLRLREMARAALGASFDIRKFHDAGLLAGAMPLPALARRIGSYVAGARG